MKTTMDDWIDSRGEWVAAAVALLLFAYASNWF
jgi:hypothetical protein